MPVSLGEWRVRIGRFVHSFRKYDIIERKEKLLKERIRLLKLLEKRLLEKKEKSEDECNSKPNGLSAKVDNAPNESSISINDTPTDSHKEDSCGRIESTIEENTNQTESTTNHKSNGDDSAFPFVFTLLLSLFSLFFALIFVFVVDFSNLLESSKHCLNWSDASTWGRRSLIIIVCSSLASIVLSYVINTSMDVQDNLVLIGDENATVRCSIEANKTPINSTNKSNNTSTGTTIKSNNSPTEMNIKDNNTQTESANGKNYNLTDSKIKETNITTESTKECNHISTNATIKVSNTPSTTKDESSEIKQSKTKTSKGKTIKEKSTTTELTTRENSTLSASTIKDNIAARESHIDTPSCTMTDKPSKRKASTRKASTRKASKRKTLISKRKTTKEKKTATDSSYKSNNTQTKSTIKENNSPTEYVTKDNNTKTESTSKDSNIPSAFKNKSSKRKTAKDKSIAAVSHMKENITTTGSTIKEKSTPTESTIKFLNTTAERTINCNDTTTESTIKNIDSKTESSIKDTNTPIASPNKGNNSISDSTIKYSNTTSRTPTEKNNNQPMKVNIVHAEYPIRSATQKLLSDGKHGISSQIPSSLKGTTDDPVMQESTCLPEMILVKAGDVELNPGPFDRSANIREQELVDLAYDVPSSKYTNLSIKLGVSYNRSKTILDRYSLDFTRSLQAVFFEWKDRQRDGIDCRQVIAAALRNVNLDALGDKIYRGGYLPQEAAATASFADGEEPLTTEQVTRCGDDFKTFYRTRLCKIMTDPLDSNSILEFERIYTNLVLLRNEMGTTRKTPLDYTELLTTKVNGVFPKRLMVEGEGGAGKTTFCSKIAWDWAERTKEFEAFDWLLVIPLRNTIEGQTVGDIAKTYLSDSNTVHPRQIDNYILSAPSKVFIIFDGLDEYEGDIFEGSSDIAKILRSEKFVECRVLVTTRPWKAVPFKSHKIMSKTFAFLAVAGFDKDNISTYITKYFLDEPPAGYELIKYIESNDPIQENMAPFPLYIALLCILWRDSDADKRNIIQKLKTFSQLFTAMIIFLKDHCLTKQHQNPNVKILTNEEMNNYLLQIGEIAYSGVLKKRLTYTENDFSGYDEAMEACCRIGVLSRTIHIAPRQDRRLNETNPVTSSVFFPHKLFQEFLAGMYLASLFESDHEQYTEAITKVIPRAEEFHYLLYFTVSQTKKVAIDIINKLIKVRHYRHILVDIAFEAYDEDSAKVVGQHLFAEQGSLEIDDEMSAHTVSGYLFIMEKLTMETLILSRRSCGPTVSRDLANLICSSTALTSLELSGTALHDDFYGTLESTVTPSKIERLSLKLMEISDEHASRKLARFLNNFPRLKDLTLQNDRFDGRCYAELASGACSVQIERLSLKLMKISDERASRNLARFLNNLPSLKDLTLQDNSFDGRFYTELAPGACSTEVGAPGHSIRKLHLDHQCHSDLLQHGFTVERLFPTLEHLYFTTSQTVSPNVVGSFAHSGLKELSFATDNTNCKTKEDEVPLVGDPSSLEQVFLNSFPRVTNLTLNNLVIGNNRCRIILSSLKQHQHLKNLCVIHCYTDEELDPIVSAINMENRMKVNIQHDKAQKRLNCMKMSSSLADALCHRTSILELSLSSSTIFSNSWFSEKNQRAVDSKVQKLTIRGCNLERNDPTASHDLARLLCLQPCLTDLRIQESGTDIYLHDDFYHELAHLASSSKIQKLSTGGCNLERNDPSASRDLARFLCLQPCLTDLTIKESKGNLHDDFYHELARLASSSKVQKLFIGGCNLERNDPTAVHDLARFICLHQCLTDLSIHHYARDHLHDDFCHELARFASSSKIQKLSFVNLSTEGNDQTASRDLARFLCFQPCLTDLTILFNSFLRCHDDFYHELARLTSSSKIQKLFLEYWNTQTNDQTALRDLARFLCLHPCLTDLTIGQFKNDKSIHDDFYHELARLASSSKIQKLSLAYWNTETNDQTALRDLARFFCLQPYLTDLTIKEYKRNIYLHDDFYHELALLAFWSKIRKLSIEVGNQENNGPTAPRDLARFFCFQPFLTDLTINRYDGYLHDDFYHELARLASCSKIQTLSIGGCNLESNDPTASRDLARFLCLHPCLLYLAIRDLSTEYGTIRLHGEFYDEFLACLASSPKKYFFYINNVIWRHWYKKNHEDRL